MNKVINIICEGPTEKEFVVNSILPFLSTHGINVVRPITMETSPGFKGGDIRYEARYKTNVLRLLRGKEDMLVTSIIDYYRLRSDFPSFDDSKVITDPNKRADFLEAACLKDINDVRFIPYIQLHEFEGLLFADKKGFIELFPELPKPNQDELLQTVAKYSNPELINDNLETAPSKRLQRLIPQYEKPLFGNMIALENGFPIIMEKCPRFNNWIQTIIRAAKI